MDVCLAPLDARRVKKVQDNTLKVPLDAGNKERGKK
jgi:hypothetical protein